MKNCADEYCECVYRLKVAVNDVVELVVIDEGVTFNANHPMHLHGHSFHVVGMDRVSLKDVLFNLCLLVYCLVSGYGGDSFDKFTILSICVFAIYMYISSLVLMFCRGPG